MQVRKRSGALEAVSFDKILNAVQRSANGLSRVDVGLVAKRAIDGMFNGISTRELDESCARACADMVLQDPEYAILGGRILVDIISEDVKISTKDSMGYDALARSLRTGMDVGLVDENILQGISIEDQGTFFGHVDGSSEPEIEVFGAYTVMERYLLKHPQTRLPIETPKQWMARVALGISDNLANAMRHFDIMREFKSLPSTPTLFNSGTTRPQLASCFLMDSPDDSLKGIYKTITDSAAMSKFAGGIAGAWTGIRSLGSLIKGTNGFSNGIVPWLKIDDASVAATNQGGKRLGAKAEYLETWHADIEDFMELLNEEGDINRRTFNLNIAHWIPDEFMRRVDMDADWSLFDPKDAPNLKDIWGDEFTAQYKLLEAMGKAKKVVKARKLYERMMRMLAETGNGWMCWKDRSNALCNQTFHGDVVHSSNLCTEITEVTRTDWWVAVCNLASMVATKYVMIVDGVKKMNWAAFGDDVEFIVGQLDSVIDRNLYTIPETKRSNLFWRPIGLGLMGLADLFQEFGMVFGDAASRELNAEIFERMYYHALKASCDRAARLGKCPAWDDCRTSSGLLHHDVWGAKPRFTSDDSWTELRTLIAAHGLRNSLMIAVAPTATIALIAGVSECTEPPQQLAIRRETMSGDFIQVNKYMVRELQAIGAWNDENIAAFKANNGSIGLLDVPDSIKARFKTAFEMSQKIIIDMGADRGPWIDQSQSLNLFIAKPTIDVLSAMYLHAWKRGLKTTYYLRRRPSTEIAKTTGAKKLVPTAAPVETGAVIEAVACPIDGSCEACQ